MTQAQGCELAAARRGEPEPDHPVVVGVLHPTQQARLRGAIDEPDRAVMTQQEVPRDVADCRAPLVVVTPHREEQLVLRRP